MTDKAIDEEPITQLARSSGGTTSSTYRGHGETPVANINYRIYRPFPIGTGSKYSLFILHDD